MSKLSGAIVAFRFLQLPASVAYLIGVCLQASTAFRYGPHIFAVTLALGIIAFLLTVATTVHGLVTRLRNLDISTKGKFYKIGRVFVDFLLFFLWLGTILAGIVPYYFRSGYYYGSSYYYRGSTRAAAYGGSIAYITSLILACSFFVSMWLILAETIRSRRKAQFSNA